jgi:methylmalonyl-CoA mutase C-terminal domain/subunit
MRKPTDSRPLRILIAKPGLDGHDRGAKVVAMALRDAGAEVVYLGLRQQIDQILEAAAQEDADVIGLSFLSGTHLPITTQLLESREVRGLSGVPVVVGGTIPPEDAAQLLDQGVAAVYPVGTSLFKVVEGVLAVAESTRGGSDNDRSG